MPESNTPTTRITFANRWTDRLTGEKYSGGDTVDFDAARARDLCLMGKARIADEDAETDRTGDQPDPVPTPDQATHAPAPVSSEPGTATGDAVVASPAPEEEAAPATPEAVSKAPRGRNSKTKEA